MDATTLMKMSEENKAILIRRALAGDAEARFVVFAKRMKEMAKFQDLAR